MLPKNFELLPISTKKLHRAEAHRVVSVAVGAQGEALRLMVPDGVANSLFARHEQQGFASFPETHTAQDYNAILSVSSMHEVKEIQLPALMATYPMIDVFPDGAALVVATRCQRWEDGTTELNARVYEPNGTLRREFILGDGIQHVQIDRKGRIWVGYFDEGVFGNFGWGGVDEAEPLGASGLSCFDDQGHRFWDYTPPNGVDSIADCYALNVAEDVVWAYYYTDFPFVRIDSQNSVAFWTNEIGGARTFAVADSKILLYGGYRENATRCVFLQLDPREAKTIGTVSLVLPDGAGLSDATVIGRGKFLHAFVGEDWYSFSVDSLPSGA